MPTYRTKLFYLSLALSSLLTATTAAQTPAPATQTPFAMPLANNSTANAAFLPTQSGNGYLVYATPTGKIGFYQLTTTTPNPTPPPTPTPPTPPEPPAPPTPPKPTTITMIAVGDAELPPVNSKLAAYLQQHGDTIATYSVAMVSDPTPPKNALHWIGLSAGKAYPYTFLLNPDQSILWQGNLPDDTNQAIALINAQTGRKKPACNCPNGICPTNNQQPQLFQPFFRSRSR